MCVFSNIQDSISQKCEHTAFSFWKFDPKIRHNNQSNRKINVAHLAQKPSRIKNRGDFLLLHHNHNINCDILHQQNLQVLQNYKEAGSILSQHLPITPPKKGNSDAQKGNTCQGLKTRTFVTAPTNRNPKSADQRRWNRDTHKKREREREGAVITCMFAIRWLAWFDEHFEIHKP